MLIFWQTQFFRFLGLCLAFIGSYLVLAPTIILFEAIPFVAFLLESTGNLSALIVSPIVGLAITLLVMTTAWIMFKPIRTLS